MALLRFNKCNMSKRPIQSSQISNYRSSYQSYSSLNPNFQSVRLQLSGPSSSTINNSKNNQNGFKNFCMPSISEADSNNTFGSQQSSNKETDTSLLISPIMLKAFTSLNQYGLKKDKLKMVENRLKDDLQVLRKYYKNFKSRMEELIEIANAKEKFAQDLMAPKSHLRDMRKKDQKPSSFSPMVNKPEARSLPLQHSV